MLRFTVIPEADYQIEVTPLSGQGVRQAVRLVFSVVKALDTDPQSKEGETVPLGRFSTVPEGTAVTDLLQFVDSIRGEVFLSMTVVKGSADGTGYYIPTEAINPGP